MSSALDVGVMLGTRLPIYMLARWEAELEVQAREWVSKERGNIIMFALLVRVD